TIDIPFRAGPVYRPGCEVSRPLELSGICCAALAPGHRLTHPDGVVRMRSAAMFTGLLIALLIIGSATVAGAGVLYAAQKRKGLRGTASDDATLLRDGTGNLIERGVRDLRVGDVIQYAGRDFLVEGVVEYDEDGHRWRGARIVDGKDEHWIIAGMERLSGGDN